MDAVFKALADPSRRQLLDALCIADGQSLKALGERLAMTRFGVMKHLRVLEEAGLVVTRKAGREKLHFLNPVPIRLVHDRWIDKYRAPWVEALVTIKATLEEERTMERVYELYIKTTPERLWRAITDPQERARYSFGVAVHGEWAVGAALTAIPEQRPGFTIFDGTVLECDPPRRLVHTQHARWSDAVQAEGPTRVTWEITPVGDSCRLVLTHDQLRDGANAELYGGWPMILSGLKTWLETGAELTTPGSLQWLGR